MTRASNTYSLISYHSTVRSVMSYRREWVDCHGHCTVVTADHRVEKNSSGMLQYHCCDFPDVTQAHPRHNLQTLAREWPSPAYYGVFEHRRTVQWCVFIISQFLLPMKKIRKKHFASRNPFWRCPPPFCFSCCLAQFPTATNERRRFYQK